jgi:tagatose 6-phosphate kinase
LVLTVTPNTALDKTYLLDHFSVDRIHRPSGVEALAGGKGVNVARVIVSLGGEAVVTGFVGGRTGAAVLDCLANSGLQARFQEVQGETRLCIAAIDTRSRTQTEINERGPCITAEEQESFQSLYRSLLDGVGSVAFCGSLPPGLPPDFYVGLIQEAKSRGLITALDTSGEPLKRGLEAVPDIVKPNAIEASDILGGEIETVGEAAEAASALLERGVKIAAVTLGRAGAVAADHSGVWYAEPPEVEFASAVGSGDAFLAGLLMRALEGRPLADAVRFATACGAANAGTYGAGILELRAVNNLTPSVSVKPLPNE